MNKLGYIAKAAIAGAIALLVTTVLSAAQDGQRPLKPIPKTHAATQKHKVMTPAKSSAKAQMKKSHLCARRRGSRKRRRSTT